jgi:hypothetical protein
MNGGRDTQNQPQLKDGSDHHPLSLYYSLIQMLFVSVAVLGEAVLGGAVIGGAVLGGAVLGGAVLGVAVYWHSCCSYQRFNFTSKW